MIRNPHQRGQESVPLTAEGLGSYGGQTLLLPLFLPLAGAPLAGVGARRLPLAVPGARARALAVLPFPGAGA